MREFVLSDWRSAVRRASPMRDRHNLPREVFKALVQMMARLEYVDNIRFARKWDGEAVEDYEKARDNGCCGSVDNEVTTASGDVWLVGCNFGH